MQKEQHVTRVGDVAVLIHGRHLDTKMWEHIIWGDPKRGVLGQVPKGLQVATREGARLIFWGTGASEKDGVKESRYTFDYAVAHAGELPEYMGFDAYEIAAMLGEVSYIDEETQNTAQEVTMAAKLCNERGITRLILVSAPTHIARCLMEAEKLRAAGLLGKLEVMAVASDVSFANSEPGNVVIIEPPHRGDRPKWQTYKYAQAMFQVQKQGNGVFRLFLEDFGALLLKYNIKVTWRPEA